MASTSRSFIFASRRRHTRLQGDWSSDVCSSDLPPPSAAGTRGRVGGCRRGGVASGSEVDLELGAEFVRLAGRLAGDRVLQLRSEERRVGKECKARLSVPAGREEIDGKRQSTEDR